MKRLPYHRALVCALLLTTPAVADEAGPPASFFVGKYEIVGRAPGANGQAYSGWAEVVLDGEELVIRRCVGGSTSRGGLAFASATADGIRVIRSRFKLQGEVVEATCQIHTDLDNYPRLTCLTYPAAQPTIPTPGVEALFHAKWPRPDAAAVCP